MLERSMLRLLALALAALALAYLSARAALKIFLGRPRFGALPAGERLERLRRSPNWSGGKVVNAEPTPERLAGAGRWDHPVLAMLRRPPRLRPKKPLPSRSADPAALPDERLVWLGHSGILLKVGGLSLLFDPVFSSHASPLYPFTRAFRLSGGPPLSSIPEVDCLLLSHDHWDHLDHRTVLALRGHVRSYAVPLGAGAHLERWGVPPDLIFEGDWGDALSPVPGLTVHLVTARHFAGRGLAWRRCLWAGFVAEAGGRRIYYSGDSGYGAHFRAAGERFGGFDLAALECGQYNRLWPLVHMAPEQTAQAAADLGAKAAMPVHCARFVISSHPWDEPLIRFSLALAALNRSRAEPIRAVTPIIGEAAAPFDESAAFAPWWEGLD
jgi:L-ascorbate metabolism protein UlaG (beta-lactamase superfamily)